MKINVFTIYDSKTEIYSQPFFMVNKGTALRAFQTTVQDPKSQISQYPEDYTLFEIGTWDDSNATIVMHDAKISLGCAIEFKNSSPIMKE